MMANKRNMVLETIGLLFLVARDDVLHPRRNSSECNEHTYGMWRTMAREFNMDQLIRIVQKSDIKTNCIFGGSLRTHRSKDGLSGYQATFADYIESMRNGGSTEAGYHGSVHVDTAKPAIDQLWDEVRGIIEFSNAKMKCFLSLFGIEEGNGLSPFARSVTEPSELKAILIEFFKPPKKDNRGCGPLSTMANDDEDDDDDEFQSDDSEDGVDIDGDSTGTLSPEMIAHHMSGINEVKDDDAPNGDDDDEIEIVTEEDGGKEVELVS